MKKYFSRAVYLMFYTTESTETEKNKASETRRET